MHLWVSSLALWSLLVICTQCGTVGALFDWLKETPTPTPAPPPVGPAAVPNDPPTFEMRVVDEKFLAEGNMMQLSPLDSCHLRVIGQLRSTCDGLSEESLAKLGVALFNCQAEVEGRRTYPCTEEMFLKECTANMDSDTWNAYHIVSNRARSVCYATRQQHFRRRAELTVNALIATATSQLDAMEDLKEGQKELRDLTAASLDKLLDGHNVLQLQQGVLRDGQEQLDASISANLQTLAQEKALISTGQELVAQLIQGISQRMENVSEQLQAQGSEVQDGHQAILDDLAEVRGRAQDIYSKIEGNMVGFLQQQNDTARFYSELMGKLERMNSTLGYLLLYLDNMQGRLEDRLHIIQRYLGWAGRWFVLQMLWVVSRIKGGTPPVALCGPPGKVIEEDVPEYESRPSSTPKKEYLDSGTGLEIDGQISFMAGDPSLVAVSPPQPQWRSRFGGPSLCTTNHSTPVVKNKPGLSGVVFENIAQRNLAGVLDTVDQSCNSSMNHSSASNGSISGRPLCGGTTKLGHPCKKRAVLGQDFCRVHEAGHMSHN
ncbi:protein brambleberry isoform X2 [Alosa alosa]|uniref:protein brambleberry isoform X2 n=1 Tax=Alosa alosa TaxID=278164 RepID=UPI0020152EFE|nr:protein brambleberry isoform X2 [Alosa alosa]